MLNYFFESKGSLPAGSLGRWYRYIMTIIITITIIIIIHNSKNNLRKFTSQGQSFLNANPVVYDSFFVAANSKTSRKRSNKNFLRKVPTNGKYFFPDNDYVRQVDHISGY